MISKEYWASLEFDYAETFSLLRGVEGHTFYTQMQEKAKYESNIQKQKELLSLSILGAVDLLHQQGMFHPTAIKTNVFTRNSQDMEQLGQILQIEFIEQSL